jgi:hypothetical protein
MKVKRIDPVKKVEHHETYNIEGLTFEEMETLGRMSGHATCIPEKCRYAYDFFALMRKIRKSYGYPTLF